MDDDTIKRILKDAPPPVIVGPKEFSLERLLSHTWPGEPGEVEEFIELIYAERRRAAGMPDHDENESGTD